MGCWDRSYAQEKVRLVELRRLGADGPKVPVICLGAWPIGGGMGGVDDAIAIATVQRAVDLGVTFIDTAEGYRRSEQIVGQALKGRRDQVFLATKVSRGDLSRTHILEVAENSLRALQTDHIDLLQAHWWDDQHPIGDAMQAFADLVESGKVRYIGVSNFNVAQMEAALAAHRFQSLQPRYSVLHRKAEDGVLPFCRSHGIGVIVYSPLEKGLLSGRYGVDATFASDDERSRIADFKGERLARHVATVAKLKAFAEERGHTTVELALAWVLANPTVTSAIVGAKTPSQLDEHVRAASWHLSVDELEEIDRLVNGDFTG